MSASEAFTRAQRHHRAGELREAEAIYRQLLAANPAHSGALHYLGVLAHQGGRPEDALPLIHQALLLAPDDPSAHSNLGEVYRTLRRYEEAVSSYRRSLELKPHQPETYNNLGMALAALERFAEAADAHAVAIRLKPDYPEACNNLGNAMAGLGRFGEAIAAYRRALQLHPADANAHGNLGVALARQGRFEEAVIAYRQALALQPRYAEVHNSLGSALAAQQRTEEAIAAFHLALECKPNYPEAHNNLGIALAGQGRFAEAAVCYRHAVECDSRFAEAHNNLGTALCELGQVEDAVAAWNRALALKPRYAAACYNIGRAHLEQGEFEAAIPLLRQALAIDPELPQAHNNLALALAERGALEDALSSYRRSLQIRAAPGFHSNLIYTLQFQLGPDTAAQVAAEQSRWNLQYAAPVRHLIRPHANVADPGRRLKIGYFSPDFRFHPVAFFIVSVLEARDRMGSEIYCYSNVQRPDAVTERLQRAADHWRDVRHISDAQFAECVRSDGIDIFVDLAMHTAGNRLPVFALKPAPLQVSWLAYPGSTGVETIDYRLTDASIDPPQDQEDGPGGAPVRLPDAWCCYSPLEEFPPVSPLPAARSGVVTFASVNQFRKINEPLLRTWVELLEKAPGSRLLIISPAGPARDRLQDFFHRHRVAPERIEPLAPCSWEEYLRIFERVDIALDTFPCNGMTTVCHCLWMGVPVVSWSGSRPISRAGGSLLRTIGVPEWVADSAEQYIHIAAALASDLPRLATWRAGLRQRMSASPLMDAPRFARHLDAAYREMWKKWCALQRAL